MIEQELIIDIRALGEQLLDAQCKADRYRRRIAKRCGDDLENAAEFLAASGKAKRLLMARRELIFSLMTRISYRRFKRLYGFSGGPVI